MPEKNKVDTVNHPPHYNNHPSGLECIEFKRYMPASLSDAFKYVWRCSLKQSTIEDLHKSIWYVEDTRDHVKIWVDPDELPTNLKIKIQQLLAYEPNILISSIFSNLLELSFYKEMQREYKYDLTIEQIRLLIQQIESKDNGTVVEKQLLDPNIDHFDV